MLGGEARALVWPPQWKEASRRQSGFTKVLLVDFPTEHCPPSMFGEIFCDGARNAPGSPLQGSSGSYNLSAELSSPLMAVPAALVQAAGVLPRLIHQVPL